MQAAMTAELLVKVALAVEYKLIPKNVSEVEWTLDRNTGQASEIEWWPSSKRLASEKVAVAIPDEYMRDFIFTITTALYKTIQK